MKPDEIYIVCLNKFKKICKGKFLEVTFESLYRKVIHVYKAFTSLISVQCVPLPSKPSGHGPQE